MSKSSLKLPNKPFSTKEALSLGISKNALSRMIEMGLLERMSRGIYQVSESASQVTVKSKKVNLKKSIYTEAEKDYISATLRCGSPSAICLLSALEYYNLTDEITNRTWIMVPESKRVRSDTIKLVRSRNPKWDIGIHKTKDYWITTIERTLIDCVVFKRIVGQQVALSSLRLAVSSRKVKLAALYELARSMGVARLLKPYIEILGA